MLPLFSITYNQLLHNIIVAADGGGSLSNLGEFHWNTPKHFHSTQILTRYWLSKSTSSIPFHSSLTFLNHTISLFLLSTHSIIFPLVFFFTLVRLTPKTACFLHLSFFSFFFFLSFLLLLYSFHYKKKKESRKQVTTILANIFISKIKKLDAKPLALLASKIVSLNILLLLSRRS